MRIDGWMFAVLVLGGSVLSQVPEPPRVPGGKEEKGVGSLTGGMTEEAFKALHDLRGDVTPPLRGQSVDLEGTLGYLSLPAGKPPFPAVLVIHEWWGMNSHIKHWCDRLAAEGYAALGVDLYQGKVATTRDEAMAAMKSVKPEEARAKLSRAHAFLKADARILAQKRGIVGWCFGGAQSLSLALHAEDLDAAVIYYGQLVTDAERLKTIKAKVCGVFGTRDPSIPESMVSAFEKGLKDAGVTHEIWRFDAEHAFANPSSARYDGKSASAAFERVQAFLSRTLKAK